MIVRFKVKYWDNEAKDLKKENGIIESETLGGAVDKIASFIDDINEITVYECEDTLYDFELEDFLKESKT